MSLSLSFNCPRSSTIFSSFKPRNPSSSSTGRIFHTQKPKPAIKKLETLAARDTIIGFGKHKGKMLGALPSSYLKWVSMNLRAGDSEFWAKLADEVLDDPVYQDRIEWEYAEKILHGSNETMRNLVSSKKESADGKNSVSMLMEISERFGWDNEDEIGWGKVDFELLGTSKSGRIPRSIPDKNEDTQKVERREGKKESEEDDDGNGGKRSERRERMKMRLREEGEGKTGITRQSKGIYGIPKERETYNPFPGRESLMRKALNRRRTLQ
ncbi:PREDICTED: uncharacterized protein LOC104817895 [Tarenaya hassleriana]|uniref:uncharacterized protein LOC104817895 n=1 Tax=Tarenaya hassleriana TaxID=28532 RepID=UPI00053C6306|nr:PREDICTED: uncharacterized protein LOC104817895 [Tarenaya hassleriana]